MAPKPEYTVMDGKIPAVRLEPVPAGTTPTPPDVNPEVAAATPGKLLRFYFKPLAWKELQYFLTLIEREELVVEHEVKDRIIRSLHMKEWFLPNQVVPARIGKDLHKTYFALHVQPGLLRVLKAA